MRLGPAFTYVTSDDARLDGGKWQTGLNVGVVGGFALSESTPVFMETGLYYIEKGGKKDLGGGKKMTYDLNYLEIPVLVKYKYEVDDEFTVEPFAGGYFAMGVGGKIKNFAEREARAPSEATTSEDSTAVCASDAAWATTCSMPTSPTTRDLPTSATTISTRQETEP